MRSELWDKCWERDLGEMGRRRGEGGGGGTRMARCDVFMPQVSLHARLDRDTEARGRREAGRRRGSTVNQRGNSNYDQVSKLHNSNKLRPKINMTACSRTNNNNNNINNNNVLVALTTAWLVGLNRLATLASCGKQTEQQVTNKITFILLLKWAEEKCFSIVGKS